MNDFMSLDNRSFEQKRDDLLLSWKDKQIALAKAKAEELDLRQQVVKLLFTKPVEGTQRYDLPAGWAVKMVYKNNYTLDKDNDKIDKAVDIIAKMGPVADEIA